MPRNAVIMIHNNVLGLGACFILMYSKKTILKSYIIIKEKHRAMGRANAARAVKKYPLPLKAESKFTHQAT